MPCMRFIPARAGNTTDRVSNRSSVSVHPRPRGEHWAYRETLRPGDGSSPPARGTLLPQSHGASRRRFIPARAGNTPGHGVLMTRVTVHPRPRGEHTSPAHPRLVKFGSSPPARGTPELAGRARDKKRFIPARAGNTSLPPPTPITGPVHPRPRGEHRQQRNQIPCDSGSSPPARGTRARRFDG